MADNPKKKPGPEAETFKVSLAFEDAVEAALKTPPPQKARPVKKPKKSSE